MLLKLLGVFLAFYLLSDLLFLLLGWAFSCVKSLHRAGIRTICDTNFGFMIAPFLCRCKCDGSCGNWVCPKYHKDPGKFEVTTK